MAKQDWASDWTVGVRTWVERNGQTVLGQGRADLLAAIDAHRSITAAAKAIGMSYRRAWTLIQEINAAAGEPLVESAVGGATGGGAGLTERGQLAVRVFRQLDSAIQDRARSVLQQVVDDQSAAYIHLSAAVSLQEAMGQILAAFALHAPAIRVRAIYGASNELVDHLFAGSPCDLFVAANSHEVDRLETAGRVVKGSRRAVAANGLACIAAKSFAGPTRAMDLVKSNVRRIALAEPACPLGAYSQAYLRSLGIYDALLPKVLHVDNSRAVASAVAAGSADVGIAFSSDALTAAGCVTLFTVSRSKAAATYVAAIVAGEHESEAGRLLDFITSPAGMRCLRRCGLRPAKTVP